MDGARVGHYPICGSPVVSGTRDVWGGKTDSLLVPANEQPLGEILMVLYLWWLPSLNPPGWFLSVG